LRRPLPAVPAVVVVMSRVAGTPPLGPLRIPGRAVAAAIMAPVAAIIATLGTPVAAIIATLGTPVAAVVAAVLAMVATVIATVLAMLAPVLAMLAAIVLAIPATVRIGHRLARQATGQQQHGGCERHALHGLHLVWRRDREPALGGDFAATGMNCP